VRWFPAGDLPTNMLDRARVALRNYADGMRFSTYPAFDPAGTGGVNGFQAVNRSSGSDGSNGSSSGQALFGAGEPYEANGVSGTEGFGPWSSSRSRREGACSAGLLG